MTKPRWILAAGVLGFWALVATLVFAAGLGAVQSLLLAALLGGVPAFALAQVPMADGVEIERLPAYVSSIIALWLIGSASWLVGTSDGGPPAIGLVGLPLSEMVGWTLLVTGAALAVMFGSRGVMRLVGYVDTDLLSQLLPRTRKEKQAFVALSFAAGIGEELAYRGFAITVLGGVVGTWGAAAASTLAFGVTHAYQGWPGVLRTTVMGAVLAAAFVFSGSLWPPMIAHVLIDLLAGLVLGERLLVKETN